MDSVVDSLQRCACVHGSTSAAEILHQWQEQLQTAIVSEEFWSVAVFSLATSAMGGSTLQEQEDAVIGLERCLGVATQNLDPAAVERLQRSVLERTLRKFNAAGDALAAKATQLLLRPGQSITVVTEPLRAVLALLLRCIGTESITSKELLELVRRDIAVAVALLTEALGVIKPAGLPLWPKKLAHLLYHLTTPDTFIFLLQCADPGKSFNDTPIVELQAKQIAHSHVIALCFVQFNVLDRTLHAAEDPAQRQSILTKLIRAVHNLVGGHGLVEPGRLLSRYITLEFMRFGFRFLAPFMRKLVDESRRAESIKLLRQTCSTLSWLLVHAEVDLNTFLATSLVPLATEWLMRGLSHGLPSEGLASIVTLAANCGSLASSTPASVQLVTQIYPIVEKLRVQVEGDALRRYAITLAGHAGLSSLGFVLPTTGMEAESGYYLDALDDDEEWPDDDLPPWMLDEEEEEGGALGAGTDGAGAVCTECGAFTRNGSYGEGYFSGLWYCNRCWNRWDEAPPGYVSLSPQPLESCSTVSAEQCGAAALLLRAPGQLRCGIGGGLLTATPVRVPGSMTAIYPVAFARCNLERWHRQSQGHCPITGEPLDLHSAVDAPDVVDAIHAWLDSEYGLNLLG